MIGKLRLSSKFQAFKGPKVPEVKIIDLGQEL